MKRNYLWGVRRRDWNRSVRRGLKLRKINNLYKNIGRNYTMYLNFDFENNQTA